MAELLRKARGLGIPEGDLRQSIDEQITASYRVNPQQAVFVECNMEDARAAVDEIEAMTGYRLCRCSSTTCSCHHRRQPMIARPCSRVSFISKK